MPLHYTAAGWNKLDRRRHGNDFRQEAAYQFSVHLATTACGDESDSILQAVEQLGVYGATRLLIIGHMHEADHVRKVLSQG